MHANINEPSVNKMLELRNDSLCYYANTGLASTLLTKYINMKRKAEDMTIFLTSLKY